MISEIVNSLFLTYLASEYIVSSSSSSSSRSSSSRTRIISGNDKSINNNSNTYNYNILRFLICLVIITNLLDHHYLNFSSLFETTMSITKTKKTSINNVMHSYYFIIPMKFCLAASSYVLALYIDVHYDRQRSSSNNSDNSKNSKSSKIRRKILPFKSVFLPKVLWTFLKILPAYPFLAVLISFLFLFVVDIWEYIFHLPLEWLNKPIYYGTLYGPFAYTYVYVKKEILITFHREDKRESQDTDEYEYSDHPMVGIEEEV